MTSGDTNDKTVALLKKYDNFGMDKDQITIVVQGDGVPALENNNAKIALDPANRYKVLAKPHGHGDIHALLHSHEVAKSWLSQGIEWTVFFQVRDFGFFSKHSTNRFDTCLIIICSFLSRIQMDLLSTHSHWPSGYHQSLISQ